MSILSNYLAKTVVCAVFALFLVSAAFSQGTAAGKSSSKSVAQPKVTKIDLNGLKELLKPKGKPLLINFWATWCDPCREEFPDLVKIDAAYRGKIDFITISLDDLADIDTVVPRFLAEMKAEMPAYLLRTPDESAAITMVSKDWQGNLPLTVLINTAGETVYSRGGIIAYEAAIGEIDKVLATPQTENKIVSTIDFVKIKDGKRDEALYYYENNWKVYRDSALKRGVIHSYELIDAVSETNKAFDLILITRYAGEEQFKNSEKNFEPILKELRPNGPSLKNSLKPEDFRQSVFLYRGTAVFASFK